MRAGSFRIVDVDEILATAKARGHSQVDLDVPMMKTYGQDAAITQTAWMSGKHHSKNYVWLHIDADGDPFYAGHGRGADAWTRNGGGVWEWFVRERLGGEYRVVILATGMNDDHALSVYEQMLEIYNKRLLNQNSFHRGMDYKALAEEHQTAAGLRPIYEKIYQAKDRHELYRLALEGQEIQYRINYERTETGRYGEVLIAMGAWQPVNTVFITHIIEGYLTQGDVDGARAALAEFKAKAPYLHEHKKVIRLQRMADLGGFIRKPRWMTAQEKI